MEDPLRMPHPFVNAARVKDYVGRPVALLGKVEKVETNQFSLKTSDGKCIDWVTLNTTCVEETVQVVQFDLKSTVGEDKALNVGQTVEVRGTVNQNQSLSFEDMT